MRQATRHSTFQQFTSAVQRHLSPVLSKDSVIMPARPSSMHTFSLRLLGAHRYLGGKARSHYPHRLFHSSQSHHWSTTSESSIPFSSSRSSTTLTSFLAIFPQFGVLQEPCLSITQAPSSSSPTRMLPSLLKPWLQNPPRSMLVSGMFMWVSRSQRPKTGFASISKIA